jgi:hypothetical protein
MLFDGPSGLSVHTADAITIQDDPTLVPFKVANVGGVVGTLEQDRLSGIRALLGVSPTPVLVKSAVNGGGELKTFVNRTRDVPGLAAFHLLGDIDGRINRIGAGTAEVGWTVVGTVGSQQFSLTRNNRYADQFDISFSSIFELADQLAALSDNPFTDVTFDTVRLTAAVGSPFREYRIAGLEQRDGAEWVPVEPNAPLSATPGTPLRVRVLLSAYRDAAPAPVEFTFPIPEDAAGTEAMLSISGGGATSGDGGGGGSGSEPASFDDLLSALEHAPRNDEILAELSLGGGEGGAPVQPLASLHKRVAEVVTGALAVPVTVAGGEEPPPPEPPPWGPPPGEPIPQPGPGGEPPALDLLGASTMRLGRALNRGISVAVQAAEPGRLVLRALVDRRTARRLGVGRKPKGAVVVGRLVRQVAAGRTEARLMLARGARRHLRHANRVTLTIRATLTGAAGKTQAVRTIVLQRH